ncbi:MAG: cytochrome c oxidase accessory protein CcoG [Bacteroidetes bacterium]|nr:MAG: cytochrome c oxidase accessory protein CcoG [Bacteroidota bacterium]
MADNKKHDSYYRDKLTSVDSTGNRVWVYAKKVKGKFYNKRQAVALVLLAVLFITPFIKYQGEPYMLFNILERKFIIFGVVFWPQDLHLILLAFITSLVFIALFTVIFGRLFCGWVCPQTIFMEFVFRKIEWAIEGDAGAQRRLNKALWDFNKIWRKSLKHLIFFGIAFVTAGTLLAYIISMDQLLLLFSEGIEAHLGGFIGLIIFSGIFYFIFAFFREQVCVIACPYGRLQGVLIDKKSIIVGYDYKRGEPRGPVSKAKEGDLGDCIACNACVAVCPTGIDIKNGTQLECINCTACMDACDAVMDRTGRPKGLIRYDSEEGIETGHHSIFNARSIAYSAVLTLLIFFVAGLFILRGDSETTILRARGTLFQEFGADSISNIYTIQVVNKIRKPVKIDLKVLSPKGNIKYIIDPGNIEKGKIGKGQFLLIIGKSDLKSSSTKVVIGIYSNGELIEEYNSAFVGPKYLDKK